MDNNKNNLDMNYYRLKMNEKKKIKYKFFDSIFNIIIEKIKIIANNCENWCLYEIPIIMFGYPEYTMNEISSYIINKFKIHIDNKNIDEIIFYEPNILYIKWSL